ncbi:MAG: YncE family protein [Roseobacter sp.]
MRLTPNLYLVATLVVSPALAGDLAYVTCQNSDALQVLDIELGKDGRQWEVPGQPAGVAVAENAVFTVAAGDKSVRKHDPHTGRVLYENRLDGGPMGVAYDPSRDRLFVSDWYNARIWVLNGADLARLQVLDVGAAPAGLAISEDGRFLASADRDADQVSLFDADTLTLLHSIPVGSRPFGLRFAPDGRLFVGNVGSDDISIIDPDHGKLKRMVAVGARPYGVAFAQQRAFITNQYADTLSVIDLDTLATIATLETGEYPEGVDASSDGKHIAVANWFENSMTVFDAATLSVLHTIDTCDGPRAFGNFLMGGNK